MSTATATTDKATAADKATVSPELLEAAIDATERQQSLKEKAAARFEVTPDTLYPMLRHKWKVKKGEEPFSDSELFLGLCLLMKYDLDPMAKEVYLGRAKDGSLMIIIAIDGWIKIVHRTGDYNGHTQEMHFDEKGDLEWVDTTIYSKSREYPTVYRGFAKEYMRLGGFMKSSLPWHMLRLFSFRHAARFFAPIGGAVVTQEEADWMRDDSGNAKFPAVSLNELADDLTGKATAAGDPTPEEIRIRQEAVDDAVKRFAAAVREDQINSVLADVDSRADLPDSTKSFIREEAAKWRDKLAGAPSEANLAKGSKRLRDLFVDRVKKARTLKALTTIMAEASDNVGTGELYPNDLAEVSEMAGLKEAEIKAEKS